MPDPISFDVSNPQTPHAGAVVYISNDAEKWGRLDITLTNTRSDNSDLALDPAGVLQIYFEMLTPDDIKNIEVPADSAWAGGPDPTNRHLALHPKDTIVIPSETSKAIELDNVLGHIPRQGKFRFYYESFGIKNAVIQGFVQRPPADDAGQWELAWVLDPRAEYQSQGNTIYVTAQGRPDIANTLLVQLYRSAAGTLPSSGTPQLSFSFAAGDLALCSQDRLKAVAASIKDQQPDGRWKDPAVSTQGEDILWTVDPTGRGGDLFSENGLLTVRFDNIVTDLPTGDAVLYIQYAGLTGYDDGYIHVPVIKVDPVLHLRSFAAYSGGTMIAGGATVDYGTSLDLRWDVFAADSVVLRDATVGPSSDRTLRPVDSATVQPVTTEVSYELIPRVAGVDQPTYGIDFTVPPATVALWVEPRADSAVVAQWQGTQGGHCTLYQDGALVADNLGLTGMQGLSAGSTFTVECHGATVATATATAKTWFAPCRQFLLEQHFLPICEPGDCAKLQASPVGHFGCSGKRATFPLAGMGRTDSGYYYTCYCCCGDAASVSAVAMAAGSRPIDDIQIGESVQVALDGALTQWSERPVEFSAGVGADPANPLIEIEFGDPSHPETILAARDHLFLMPEGVLKRAARLVAGKDLLMRPDGSAAPVIRMAATAGRRVHHVATSREPAAEFSGHLIIVNGIVCGDYALQVSDLDSIRPQIMADGHADLPEFGSEDYARG